MKVLSINDCMHCPFWVELTNTCRRMKVTIIDKENGVEVSGICPFEDFKKEIKIYRCIDYNNIAVEYPSAGEKQFEYTCSCGEKIVLNMLDIAVFGLCPICGEPIPKWRLIFEMKRFE